LGRQYAADAAMPSAPCPVEGGMIEYRTHDRANDRQRGSFMNQSPMRKPPERAAIAMAAASKEGEC